MKLKKYLFKILSPLHSPRILRVKCCSKPLGEFPELQALVRRVVVLYDT